MKIRATATKGKLMAGVEYDLPESEAMAAVMAGNAVPLAAGPASERETVTVNHQTEKRWRTR